MEVVSLKKTSIRLLPKTQRGEVKKCWSCSKEKPLHYRDYSVGGDICLDCFNDAHDVEQYLVNNKYLLEKNNGIRHPHPNEFSDETNH